MNNKEAICQVRALYPYESSDPSSLSFKPGSVIDVLAQLESGWWDGWCNGKRGWFPSNYVEVIKETNEPDEFELWELQQQQWKYRQQQNNLNYKQRMTDREVQNRLRLSIYASDTLTQEPSKASTSPPWVIQTTEDGSEQYYYNTQTQEMRYSIPPDFYDNIDDKMKRMLADSQNNNRHVPEFNTNYNGSLLPQVHDITDHYERSPPVRPVRAPNRVMANEAYNQHTVDYINASFRDKTMISQNNSTPFPADAIAQQRPVLKEEQIEYEFQDHEKLPPNWVRKITPKGRYYYYNVKTDETTWELENIDPDTGMLVSLSSDSFHTLPNYQSDSNHAKDVNENALQQQQYQQYDYAENAHGDEKGIISWQDLSVTIAQAIHKLKESVRQGETACFVEDTTSIVHRIRRLLYVSNCLEKETSIYLQSNKQLRSIHRTLLAALAKLALSTKVASNAWPPPEALIKLQTDADDLLIAVRNFITFAQDIHVEIKENQPTLSPHELKPILWSGNGSNFPLILKNPANNMLVAEQSNVMNAISVLADNVRGAMGSYTESVRDAFLPLEHDDLKESLAKLKANAPLLVAQFRNLSNTTSHFLNAVEEICQRQEEEQDNDNSHDMQISLLFHPKQTIYNAMGSLFVVTQTITNVNPNANQVKTSYEQLKVYVNSIEEGIQHVIKAIQKFGDAFERSKHRLSDYDSTRNTPTPTQKRYSLVNNGEPAISNIPVTNNSSRTLLSDTLHDKAEDDDPSEDINDAIKRLDIGLNMLMPTRSDHRRMLSDDSHILSDDGNNDNGSYHSDMTTSNYSSRQHKEAKITKFFGEDTIAAAHHRDTILGSPSSTNNNDPLTVVTTHATGASSSTGSSHLAATTMTSSEVAWYLASDMDLNEIIYNMEGKVKGGTLHALVQHLTQHDQLDSKFNTTFLLTYRSFCTTQELFNELFNRYQLAPPESITSEELDNWKEKKLKLVRLRVFNVIKSWLETYFNEEEDRPILPEISHFTENVIVESMKFGAEQLAKLIKKRLQAEDSSQIRKMKLNVRTGDMPVPILPKNMKRIKLLELDPHELARQMTIMDFRLYNRIKPVECLDKNWGKPDTDQDHIAANIKASIEHSNQVTAWVTDSILSKEEVKKRATVLKHWIFVAERCRLLNNYNTCMAILSAFDNGSIGRLKRTWELISARAMQILQNIRRLMGANRNFSEYRDIIHKVNPPCIPFLGIYLQDLTFIEDGNSNFLKKTNSLINFAKRMKTAEVIQDLQQYQSTHYMLTAVPDIQEFIKTHLHSSREEEELYNLSLKLEPRERGEDTIARRLKESGL